MTRIARTQDRHDHETPAPERGVPEKLEKLTKMARTPADAERERGRSAYGATDAAGDGREEDRHQAGGRPAAEPGEFQRIFAEFAAEQTRQSMDTFSACARAGSLTELASAQGKLVTDSLMRIGQFNARYGELLLRGMTAVPTTFRR